MMSVSRVRLEWYKNGSFKTLLDIEWEVWLAKQYILNYIFRPPRIRKPGEITYLPLVKLSTPWRLRWETGIGNI